MLRTWTKKLGQKHYTRDGMDTTLCGKPMLGNNYGNVIPECEQVECKECAQILEGERVDDKTDIISDLYMMMQDIAERGKKYAEEFKKINGDHWEEDDCHGYVKSFLDGEFNL